VAHEINKIYLFHEHKQLWKYTLNHLGNFVHAWTGMKVSGDPLWAEAKATLLVVSSTQCLGLDNIIFEGDALNVIEPIHNSFVSPTLSYQLYHCKHQQNF
jgi:hypothetical protein